jgi:hypothetical protein
MCSRRRVVLECVASDCNSAQAFLRLDPWSSLTASSDTKERHFACWNGVAAAVELHAEVRSLAPACSRRFVARSWPRRSACFHALQQHWMLCATTAGGAVRDLVRTARSHREPGGVAWVAHGSWPTIGLDFGVLPPRSQVGPWSAAKTPTATARPVRFRSRPHPSRSAVRVAAPAPALRSAVG